MELIKICKKINLKKYLLFCIFVCLTCYSYAFTFSPLNFDKRIDSDEAYQEFFIKNDSNKTLKYQIQVFSNNKENDISKYITVYPKVITIEPKTRGSFKVFVDDSKEITDGQKGFMINIRNLKLPNINSVGKNESNSSVGFKMALNLEMFAYKGEVGTEFNLLENQFYKKNGKKYWKGNIENKNGRGYEIAIGFLDRMEYLYGVQNLGRLFNNSTAKIDVEIPEGAKYIVFWDNNNYCLVGQKIKIK